jgi:hypothetical protein
MFFPAMCSNMSVDQQSFFENDSARSQIDGIMRNIKKDCTENFMWQMKMIVLAVGRKRKPPPPGAKSEHHSRAAAWACAVLPMSSCRHNCWGPPVHKIRKP